MLSRGTASGRWRLATKLALGACLMAGSSAVPGSRLQYFKDGTSAPSLHDLAVLMVIVSDNMATNLPVRMLEVGPARR